MSIDVPYYQTSDTPLATWLVINNIKHLQTDNNLLPAVFYFENNDRLAELIFAWDTGNAIGNCVTFQKTYKVLVRQTRNGKGGNGQN